MSVSDRMDCCKILWSLKATRLLFQIIISLRNWHKSSIDVFMECMKWLFYDKLDNRTWHFYLRLFCKFIPCWMARCWVQILQFLPEASFGLRVLSLPASVCVCLSVCLSVCQSLACPHDNSGPIQARITKFGPKMQKTLVKVPIVLWTDQPSRSNLIWKSKFTPFWACPHHNSPPIQAKITKFGPEVQTTLAKIPIVLWGNWPWPSRSNMT